MSSGAMLASVERNEVVDRALANDLAVDAIHDLPVALRFNDELRNYDQTDIAPRKRDRNNDMQGDCVHDGASHAIDNRMHTTSLSTTEAHRLRDVSGSARPAFSDSRIALFSHVPSAIRA